MLTHRPLLSAPSQIDSPYQELGLAHTPPEINLIPFIDVLLVILIFLMLSTTFTQYQELSINLPTASGSQTPQSVSEIKIAISKEGVYALNGVIVQANQLGVRIQQIAQLTNTKSDSNPNDKANAETEITPSRIRLVVLADAKASHQSVMYVLELASQANIGQVVFATQEQSPKPSNLIKR